MTVLFDKVGIDNTIATLERAHSYCEEHELRDVVIASTTGYTAKLAVSYFKPEKYNLVIVTHNTGFKENGVQEFSREIREDLESRGVKVYTGTMVLRNLNRAIRDKLHFSETEIVNATLRMFGEGTKVCFEICAMACDAGLIPPKEVMAIAGTGSGADTAAVIIARPSNRFFDMKLVDFVVKPSLRK